MNNIISIIGPGKDLCTDEMYNFSLLLGEKVVDQGFLIACGGMSGVMEAVCKGAKKAVHYSFGKTIGIIPSLNKNDANRFCDIVIPTGLNQARNQLVVATGDKIVAIGGGAGTLSELAFAWQMNKKVICYTGFEGWSKKMAGIDLDKRQKDLLFPADSLEKVIELITF